MVSQPIKLKKSTITALIALCFLGSLFCLSLATPGFYYDVVYAGILISSALTVYYWRKERKADAKTSPIGIWIVLGVILLFVVLCLLLPAL
jgi:low temperature requirement protein LtrA